MMVPLLNNNISKFYNIKFCFEIASEKLRIKVFVNTIVYADYEYLISGNTPKK